MNAELLNARPVAFFAGLVLLLSCNGCSRPSAEPPSGSGGSRATAGEHRPEAALPIAPLPAPKPPATPRTPSVPPQLIACGHRDFYRITERALEVFEIAPKLPPPQIRGSRIARQSTEVAIEGPLSVLSAGKSGGALVIAKAALWRYELGQTQARRYEPEGALPEHALHDGLGAWPDPRRNDSFWVHVQGERDLRNYTLGRPATGGAVTKSAMRMEPLPDFDSRLFAVLADGSPLYSTPKGLVGRGQGTQKALLRDLPASASLAFADPIPSAYWVADAAGNLERWSVDGGTSPTAKASVPGVVIDTALDGDRLAVLTIEVAGQSYRPTVTVFSQGKQVARLAVAPSPASLGLPKLDLCLVSGRSWVVVGGTQWLQLLDFDSPRLLAEW